MNHPFTSSLLLQARSATQRGFTLVELMVSITIGMLIVAALLALFVNVSRTNNEMAKANRQIENGRFAIQLLQNDLAHAGFWGNARPPVPTAVPDDPCLAPGSWDAAYRGNLLAFPVLGYDHATVPGSCTTVSGAQTNSDVVVVRHANTCTAGSTGCDGGSDTGPHIQVSGCTNASLPEPAYVIDASTFPLRERDCSTIAARRKVVSNIYFVAGNTLMRSSLVNGAYQAAQPLIEGIEAMRIEYGVDNDGDGSPEPYTAPACCTAISSPPTSC
ncbi:MAG: PilW family protein [Halopseudomonas sp.]